jgi:hypothetical protein
MSELIPQPDPGEEDLAIEELEGAAGGNVLSEIEIQSNCGGNCGCE